MLTVDLREAEAFDKLQIHWKNPAARYKIEISQTEDGEDWTLLREVSRAEVGFTENVDTFLLDLPQTARRFRLTTVERENTLSIYRFSVYDETSADRAAAQAVDDQIDALGEITSLAQKEKVEDARAAYAALTDRQQAWVTRLSQLEAAEKKIAELEAILPGDVDGDRKITVSDVVALRQTIVSGQHTEREMIAGDLDESGTLTVSDVVALRALIVQG